MCGASSISKVPGPTCDRSSVARRCIEKEDIRALGVLEYRLTGLRLNTGNGNRIAVGVVAKIGRLNGQANHVGAIGSIGMRWILHS